MIDLRYKKQVYQGNFVLRNYCRQVKFHSNKKILLEKVAKNQRIFKFSMVQCFFLFFFTADQRNYRIVTNIDKRNIEQPLSLGIWITVFFLHFLIIIIVTSYIITCFQNCLCCCSSLSAYKYQDPSMQNYTFIILVGQVFCRYYIVGIRSRLIY